MSDIEARDWEQVQRMGGPVALLEQLSAKERQLQGRLKRSKAGTYAYLSLEGAVRTAQRDAAHIQRLMEIASQ